MRRQKALALLGFGLLSALGGQVRADTEASVLATYPTGDEVVLGTNQSFYARIGYSTDESVRIWARPYFQGVEVGAGSNPSTIYSGSGEAIGWFFLMEPGERVDEIRILVGDGTASGTRVIVSRPVRIVAGDHTVAATSEPTWVTELRRENERRQRESYEARMSTPSSLGETLLISSFMLAVFGLGLAGIAAPSWAMFRWDGGWRVAAAVPFAATAFIVLRIIFGTTIDPTSHNLWPFEISRVGLISIVVVGLLAAARKIRGVHA